MRLIDGVPVTRVDLSTQDAPTPAHAAIDLGIRAPALIHLHTALLLGLGDRGPINVSFTDTGYTLANLDSVASKLESLESLTREHARELDSLPVVLVLGLPAFAGHYLTVDLSAGRITISENLPDLPAAATTSTLPLAAEGYGYWLTAKTRDGETLRVQFSTREYDTRISAATAQRLGHPGGDFDALIMGTIDLMEYAVLRPSDFGTLPEPRPDIILGTDLLQNVMIAITPDQDEITLVPLRKPRLALDERAFFVARAARDLTAVEQFVIEHPESRLASEATEAFLWLNLEQPAPNHDRIRQALKYRAASLPAHRRAEAMVTLADEFIEMEEQRTDALDLALLAVEEGRTHVADDDDAAAIHRLNARAGLVALLREQYPDARRLLLAALFGLPQDKFINLWLGRLYEKTDQPLRAWSRYVVSALQDEPPIGALSGLDRLTEDAAFREKFSMQRAALLLEGRIPAFATSERLESTTPPTLLLVELFTSIWDSDTLAAELAFEAIESYLEPSAPVCVQYHLQDVLADPRSEQRAQQLNVTKLPALYINGRGPVTIRGDESRALAGFTAAKTLVPTTADSQAAVHINGQAKWTADQLHVELTAYSDSQRSIELHAVLRERLVFAPGPNQRLLHHNVVRAGVSPAAGWPITVSSTRQTRTAKLDLRDITEQRRKSLASFEAEVGGRSPVHPVYVDRNATDVICYACDAASGEILAACIVPTVQEQQ